MVLLGISDNQQRLRLGGYHVYRPEQLETSLYRELVRTWQPCLRPGLTINRTGSTK